MTDRQITMHARFNCGSHKDQRWALLSSGLWKSGTKREQKLHSFGPIKLCVHACAWVHACVYSCAVIFQRVPSNSWWKGLLGNPGETCLPAVSAAVYIDHCHLNEQQQQSNRKGNYILPFGEIELIVLAKGTSDRIGAPASGCGDEALF